MKLNEKKGQAKDQKKNNLKTIMTKFLSVYIILLILSMIVLKNISFAKEDIDKSDVESEFLTSIDMVLDILENDTDISDYANTYKYIYYKYTGDEDYKTELDFSAYDTSDFSTSSSSSNYACKDIAKGVLALKDRILAEAKKNGIEEYIDVLLALVMQESGGSSSRADYATNYDVFQSSESKGLPPNTLNTEQSIKQGVAYFAGQLKKCGYDVDFALQAYNFGGGFITFAKPRGGYSKANAVAFAKQQSGGRQRDPNSSMYKNAGKWEYGDQNYVEHVRRFLDVSEGGAGEESSSGGTYKNGEKTYHNYKQYDYTKTPPWYNATGSWGTIKDKGCMPSSISIIASGYGKKSKSGSLYTPATIVKEILPGLDGKKAGSGVLSTYSNIVSSFRKLGLKAGNQKYTSSSGAKDDMLNHLKKGNPIIIHASSGYYTGGGHFMTLLGCKGNKVYLSNPGSSSKHGYVNISTLISRNVDWYVLVND